MHQHEANTGMSLDQRPGSFFKSISLAFRMNEILLPDGEDRDNGRRDVSWNSIVLGWHYLLARYEYNGEKYYQLTASANDSHLDGYTDEFIVTFTAEKGITATSGDLPDELAGKDTTSEEARIARLGFLSSLLDTYDH